MGYTMIETNRVTDKNGAVISAFNLGTCWSIRVFLPDGTAYHSIERDEDHAGRLFFDLVWCNEPLSEKVCITYLEMTKVEKPDDYR